MPIDTTVEYVCNKCKRMWKQGDNLDDCLVARLPETEDLYVRCPEHITRYAIRKAGGQTLTRDGIAMGLVGNWEYEIIERRKR
jgi:DNA-directed RNA polymerase subunit RPC12/RpoP